VLDPSGHARVTRPACQGRECGQRSTVPAHRGSSRAVPRTSCPPPARCGRGGGERSEAGVRGGLRATHASPLRGKRGGAAAGATGVRGVPPRTKTCAVDCRTSQRGWARHAAPLQNGERGADREQSLVTVAAAPPHPAGARWVPPARRIPRPVSRAWRHRPPPARPPGRAGRPVPATASPGSPAPPESARTAPPRRSAAGTPRSPVAVLRCGSC